MRIVYLIRAIDLPGETQRSIITQANTLGERHEVAVVSVLKTAKQPFHAMLPRVRSRHLVDTRPGRVRLLGDDAMPQERAEALHDTPSLLAPRWAAGFSSLTDVALEEFLGGLDADVVITTSPVLPSFAARCAPASVAVVHQEHRASQVDADRRRTLLSSAPLADLVTVLNDTEARWMRDELGPTQPPVAAVPHPLGSGFKPRSRLNRPLIVASGALVHDKGFIDLIRAFALVSDQLPGWRLRIFGKGPRRRILETVARRLKLFDRVEFPGTSPDMAGEWAAAGVAAVTSHADGMPLAAQQAMAAGVPVVSYDCPTGPRELLMHERSGLLVPPESVPGLASALLRVAKDDELREALGRGALEASRRFDAEIVARSWERLLGQVVHDRQEYATRSRVARRAEALRASTGAAAPGPDQPARAGEASMEPSLSMTLNEARSVALRCAVDTAVRASTFWFVIPASGTQDAPTLVLPASTRTRYLETLENDPATEGVVLHDEGGYGWPESFGPVKQMTRDLRRGQAARFSLQVGSPRGLYGQGCGVRVEFWDGVNGTLTAPVPNLYLTQVSTTEEMTSAKVNGVEVRTLPLMTEPTVLEGQFPVDVVYTWVNGADEAWLSRRERRLAALQGRRLRVEAGGAGRYTSRDELKYSLRSIHLFAPWVRHIYLVTDRQVPDWLDTSHPDITVVDHTEILDETRLPTFNSHAIETGLHRIANLSEQFVYFNDDVFLGRPVDKSSFFTPSGQPAAFMSPQPIGLPDPDKRPHLLAALNNRDLLQRDFGRVITSALFHTPHPLTRSLMDEVEHAYPDEFARTAAAPFRSPTDIAPVTSLAQHYALLTGQGFLGELSTRFITLNGADLDEVFGRLLAKRDADSICLGDYHEYVLSASTVDEILRTFFAGYFPVRAPWEKGTG